MLEAQQHLSAIEKNHVTQPSPRAERLDERIAADWRITGECVLELLAVVAIFRFQNGDAAFDQLATDGFRIAPFENAGKSQIFGYLLDHRTVLRLPRRRHRHADLSGDVVGRRLVDHDGELGRRRHQCLQPDQTAPSAAARMKSRSLSETASR